jgi:hypothetical protein
MSRDWLIHIRVGDKIKFAIGDKASIAVALVRCDSNTAMHNTRQTASAPGWNSCSRSRRGMKRIRCSMQREELVSGPGSLK